jgi:hypothetical protein
MILNDFSGGLNTRTNLFSLSANQAVECLNVDLSRKWGAIAKRKGFTNVTDTLRAKEPTYGIFGFTSRSGDKKLFSLIPVYNDTNAIGLGQLVISDPFEYSPDTADGAEIQYLATSTHKNHIYTGVAPYWVKWRNNVIGSNGFHVPWISTENGTHDLVPFAPGGIRAVPMNRSAELNGEYRYVVGYYTDCGAEWADTAQGVVSPPVYAYNEMVMITNFPSHTYDTTCRAGDADTGNYDIALYRTKANPGEYGVEDTLWLIKYLADQVGANVDTLWLIDSIPDDSFGAGG